MPELPALTRTPRAPMRRRSEWQPKSRPKPEWQRLSKPTTGAYRRFRRCADTGPPRSADARPWQWLIPILGDDDVGAEFTDIRGSSFESIGRYGKRELVQTD